MYLLIYIWSIFDFLNVHLIKTNIVQVIKSCNNLYLLTYFLHCDLRFGKKYLVENLATMELLR